jgi:hypothetical protein
MSEWWTYSLSDFLLFSPRTYYRLFELYNADIWPAQVVALALGLAILAGWLRGTAWAGRGAGAVLAACWLWVAWAYLLVRYDTINWAAGYFAAGFAAEALLLAWFGIMRNRLDLRPGNDPARATGLGIFAFALLVQPLIGPLLGRPWTQVEIFGIAPDPTAVATLGIALAGGRRAWQLLPIPLLWCAVSGATLWTMQSAEAWVMPVAAAVVLLVAGWTAAVRRHA